MSVSYSSTTRRRGTSAVARIFSSDSVFVRQVSGVRKVFGARKLSDALTLRPESVRVSGRSTTLRNPTQIAAADTAAVSFAAGYTAALGARPGGLHSRLEAVVASENLGFAVEGAAMARTMLDLLDPRSTLTAGAGPRARALLEEFGSSHPYTLHAGVGWAYDRLRRRPPEPGRGWDPLLRALIDDGWGFSRVFARGAEHWSSVRAPRSASDLRRIHVDQGVGRALWFVLDGDEIPAAIASVAPERRGELWTGLGLALTYAGCPVATASSLRLAAGEHGVDVAVGSLRAARARSFGGVGSAAMEGTGAALIGLPLEDALALHDRALEGLDPENDPGAYRRWQLRVRQALLHAERSGQSGSAPTRTAEPTRTRR
ncbi:uncharacterized protein DUF1702 [Rathayibacter iranicus NCPPB 2253 = VKM Ac-1602]|nr:DUF1702 family protein [Rathayibacter iranicus]PWJ63993.1 uncharacterized protein DUF1702 [Rathayibacter iranicus NCPPB 2253 = VKM Ac-1602]